MKRRFKALFMALVMVLTTLAVSAGDLKFTKAAEGDINVNIHYFRQDGQYSGWDAYLWLDNQAGTGYAFDSATDENGSAVAHYTVPTGTSKLNYIIRKGGDAWSGKDVTDDQSINLENVAAGDYDVYIISGVKGYVTEWKNIVSTAKATDSKTIAIELFTIKPLETTDPKTWFSIKNANGKQYTIDTVTETATNKYTITITEDLEYLYETTITFEGKESLVVTPDYYSTNEFESTYAYDGDDLGATYTAASTTFKVWAPTATSVDLNLYTSGTAETDDCIDTVTMVKGDKGVWSTVYNGDLDGVYYTYTVTIGSNITRDVIDPYARTSGVNGNRGMVINLDSTDPEGWDKDTNPNKIKNYTDAVLYELHIRDFSYDTSSGITNRGKYLAFTELGTKNSAGQSTGVDYLKDLGITHVHLMPTYDYASVDESKDTDQFNWGYDPQNFNIPEGSYSTDAYDGYSRVKEFKQMVQSLHNNGISVVMDMVYGHVYSKDSFSINKIVPNYFSRPNSNGSDCGNDTATARVMNRKYIVDSLVYWATEYHVDGFRFDQSYLFDVETMNAIVSALHAIDPSILIYNEGWGVSTNPTKEGLNFASQGNADMTPGIAYFNDVIRDGIKGGVFDAEKAGYVTRDWTRLGDVINAITANAGWLLACDNAPSQSINYVSCHDNLTLFDKIQSSSPDSTDKAAMIAQNILSASIVYTSQGIPFIQAGEELLRTKQLPDGTFWENSYSSGSAYIKDIYTQYPDFSVSELSAIKYDDLSKPEYQQVHDYYKGLIEFRKNHAGLRMPSTEEVDNNLEFINKGDTDHVIQYTIKGGSNGEVSDGLVVVYNPNVEATTVNLPEGEWNICVNKEKAGTEVLGKATGSVVVDGISCMILVKGKTVDDGTVGKNEELKVDQNVNNNAAKNDKDTTNSAAKTGDSMQVYVAVLMLLVAGVVVVAFKKRRTE